MITLDYRTNNPRWGLRGIVFQSWESYSYTLGYLSNPNHYVNIVPRHRNADISLHIEGNNEQGAWNKEGRIHYYGVLGDLENTLSDLYACSSAGTRDITRRINSNGYIISLIRDYGFEVRTYTGYTTADVFPIDQEPIVNNLIYHLQQRRLPDAQINNCVEVFREGYYL